jgi:hypothetical protein
VAKYSVRRCVMVALKIASALAAALMFYMR